MSEEQIRTLEQLAALDAEISILERDLGEADAKLVQRQDRLGSLDAQIARTRGTVEEMERSRSELQTELRQNAVQIDKSREKMSRCRNEREANAVQRELDELRRIQRERDQEIQKLGALADEARTELARVEGLREGAAGDRESAKVESDTRKANLQGTLESKRAERAAVAKKLPGAQLRKYDVIRSKVGTALAHSADGTCSACHVSMPPMQFQRLRSTNGIDQCPSCKRLVYFRAAPQLGQGDHAEDA